MSRVKPSIRLKLLGSCLLLWLLVAGMLYCLLDAQSEIPRRAVPHAYLLDHARLTTFLAGSGVLAVLLALLFSGYITRRLKEILSCAADVAAGDRGRRLPVRSSDELGDLAAVFNDLAGRIEQQDACLGGMTTRLEHSSRDLAMAFHELRTPVTNIIGFAETLRSGLTAGNPEKSERFLGIIAAQADRMAKLLDDLQTLMDLESGRRRPDPEPLSLEAAVNRVVEQIAEQFSSRGLELHREGLEGRIVAADPHLLELVLLNLLNNAVTFTPAGGKITISGTEDGARIILSISDTGIGIPEQELPRIFERYYRVDTRQSREQGGNGLGLTLVREIVLLHGGEITVDSVPGKRTTVAFSLPLVMPDRRHGSW